MQLQDQFGGDKDVLLRFKKTLALMQALDGGNGTLLRLIGGCNLDSNDPIAYVEHGTGLPLSEYLMVKQDATWSEKLWIASQVAKAMVHLHDLGCMHRDVSWSSVFVDATGDVKVFAGLKMRQVQLDKSYLTNGITEARWGAPETLAETDDNDATTYTDKIDIFGLGLVLISLVTCELPFTHVTSRGRAVPIDDNLVAVRLSKRETAIPMLTQPFDDPNKCPSKEYEALAFACIRYDPERRPTAHEVVRRLEMIRQAYNGGLGCTTPNDIKVDVTITLVTTTVVPTSKVSASSYDMWCELKIDDCDRDPIQLERVTGSVTHAVNQYATLRDIEPLAHTVEVTLKSTATTTSTIGKISIPLMEFLKLAMNASALTTVGPTTYPIFKDGDIVGFLDIAVQFGGCLREYLEHFERRATEYLRNAEAGPSTLDLCKKRDLAAQALSSSVDIDKAMPRMDTTRVTTRSNVTDAVASLPLERQVEKTPNGPSVQDDMAPPVTRVTPHATPGGDASTEEASVAAIQPQRALTADKLPSRAVHPSLGHLPPKMMEMKLAVTCEWCNEENVPTASLCAHCGEEMPPVEERLELVHASYEGTAANKKLLEDYAALASQVETFEVELALLRRWTDVRGDLMADRDFEAAHQQLEAKYQKHFNALGEEKKKLQQERADVLTLQSTPYIDAKEVDFVDEQPLWRGDLFILHKVSLKNRVNNEVVTLVRKSLDPSAVEALRWNGALVTTLDKVKRSFANLRRLNGGHGSLIQILGASGLNDMSENPTIYMPYMPGGSLRNLLEKTPAAAALPWTTRLVMAFTIARGLYELHAIDHTHRDINSFHVLVDDEHRVVLTGFSQLRQPSLGTMTGNVGDVRWAAPETMNAGRARYSEKAAIFSFGKVLEELATHALPYSSFRVGDKVISEHALEQRLANVTLDDPILQHNLDPSTPAYYAAIVEKCLVLEPSSRPTILTVLNSLRREVEKYLFPLQPPVTEPMHVQVEVQQAKGLHGTDPRPMEVQCNVSLGGDQSHTGFAAERGSSPTWNHRMDFRPQELVFMTLEARVYQKLDDELVQIGICSVPLQTMLPRQGDPTDSDWVVELEAPLFKDGNHCGELVLKVTFAGEGRLRWRDQYFDRLEYIDDSIKNERDPVRAATARVIRGMYAVDV
ncbi:TKL protein kinase [Saprolegnia diclina VS20]|uniref:TKL protein kinase n=1 Tax=Saprolegnia diclina (strain VS20) TaxID=1156394 RepID=T0RGL7_SAPDV|nr:TKL protein kinase [Saprolegnia diclina VS20]EQC28862.1 TKL protein kinase [Saprolegnia diclina VS20]|eukprot:XP_008617679.1 TKL protein kinase [Saprolegnia diclina VS20]